MNDVIDWKDAGQTTFMFLVGVMMAYNAWRAGKTAKTIDVIHVLTNSQMTLQKKSLAEVTAAKAALTVGQPGNAADVASAKAAEKDYLEHVAKLTK